jgi:hypothetical protein
MCDGFKSKIKSFLSYVNIFDIPRLTREISCDVKLIREKYDKTIKAIEDYKKELELERDKRTKERNLFLSVLDHLDDMVWAKDLEGKYIVANKAFREKFCYGISWDELQGMTDIELAKKFKKQVGEKNHTFGELCANSDIVVQRSKLPQKFLEDGNINGKLMKLVVNKSIVVNYKNDMFAICGSGRDVTDWFVAIEKAIKNLKANCSCFDSEEVNKILDELNKFKFEEGDHVKQ